MTIKHKIGAALALAAFALGAAQAGPSDTGGGGMPVLKASYAGPIYSVYGPGDTGGGGMPAPKP